MIIPEKDRKAGFAAIRARVDSHYLGETHLFGECPIMKGDLVDLLDTCEELTEENAKLTLMVIGMSDVLGCNGTDFLPESEKKPKTTADSPTGQGGI